MTKPWVRQSTVSGSLTLVGGRKVDPPELVSLPGDLAPSMKCSYSMDVKSPNSFIANVKLCPALLCSIILCKIQHKGINELIAFMNLILIMTFSKSVAWVLRRGPACIDVMPFNFRIWTPSWVDGWTGYVAQIASIACGYEISPVGFTRRSRVYRRDAIQFQGFVEIERTSLIFDYY